jgi:Na+-transporting NADH:ubiquinone oxidoreductase subunit NqrB
MEIIVAQKGDSSDRSDMEMNPFRFTIVVTSMMLFHDARDFQILFLLSFLCLGVWARDWTLHLPLMIAVVAACIGSQFLFNRAFAVPNSSLRSAWITAISLCLLLRANSITAMIAAGVLAIACKFVFRFRGKHFFNPSNFGIVAVLLLTNDAWVTPGQWGQDLWYALFFLATGAMIVRKVGRWDTTAAFLFSYALLEGARNLWLGWTWDVYLNRMMSGSLLLFSFFMITDPRAIPDRKIARVLWAVAVAALTYVFRNKYFIPTAPFWALFALSPVTILLDHWWPTKRFEWIEPNRTPDTGHRTLSGVQHA